ncbi:MAG: 2-C-methyl-D-erythritol 4-phosphate cytidylyltransferase [Microthrixaceae bacterium]
MDVTDTGDGAATAWCVLVAAGSGTRFGGVKQLAPLGGHTVLEHSLLAARVAVDGVVVVAHPEALAEIGELVGPGGVVVAGGSTRSESSRLGVQAVPDDAEVILVHDAARPLASAEVFARVIGAVRGGADGAVPVVPVTDTVRDVDGSLVDRERLVAIQTPQGFSAELLRRAVSSGGEATDDAALVAELGGTISYVEGDPANRKITHPDDLVIAEALLADRARSEVPR